MMNLYKVLNRKGIVINKFELLIQYVLGEVLNRKGIVNN